MPKKCPPDCVSKKKYDDLLVENRALKEKIKALEMGKLPVKKINSSDPIDSGSAGFETVNDSPISPFSDEFESADTYVSRSPVFSPVGAKKKRGKKSEKKKSEKKKKGRRGKGKTVKRIKG